MKCSCRYGRFKIRQKSSRWCRSRHTPLSLVTVACLLSFNVAYAQEPTSPPAIGLAAFPRDLSPWGMFMNADVVVKAVMVGLVFASVMTWTVCLAKTIELLRARRRVRSALSELNSLRTLPKVKSTNAIDPAAAFCAAAIAELQLSDGATDKDGLKERITSRLERMEAAFSRRNQPRHRSSCNHWRDRPLRRAVRHRVGHHEQLYRHLEIAHNKSSSCRAGHC